MKHFYLSFVGLFVALLSYGAEQTVNFTYNVNNGIIDCYGLGGVYTHYDVAIRVNDPMFIGAKVKSMSVQYIGTRCQNPTAWLSTRLNVTQGKNSPDITEVTALYEGGFIQANFGDGYVIPEKGLYVGYSFDNYTSPDNFDPYPVAAVERADAPFYSFMMRTNSQGSTTWNSYAQSTKAVSPIVVVIEGTFIQNSVSSAVQDGRASKNEDGTYTVVLTNQGTNVISNVDYSYTLNGQAVNGQQTLTPPLAAVIGSTSTIEVPVAPISEAGVYPIDFTLTKVNGEDNLSESKTSTGNFNIYAFKPTNRPLVEEFTGLWCGWCPRGYVALETMKERYGDQFVAVAFHDNSQGADAMAVTNIFPVTVSGFPAADINRSSVIDPGSIYGEWPKYREELVPADIDVTVEWADEMGLDLKATATVNFATDFADANYRIGYLVVEDGMSSSLWYQRNYFSTQPGQAGTGPIWDIFRGKDEWIPGLTFNDVVVIPTDYEGISGSLPKSVQTNTPYSHTHTFDTRSAISLMTGSNLIQDKTKLRVIAYLYDAKTRRIVNSNSSAYAPVPAGISQIGTDAAEVVSTEWYDLQGRRVSAPSEGLYIRLDRLSDGSSRRTKVAL